MTSPRIVFFGHSSSREDERSSNHWFPYGNSGDFDTNLAMILVILVCSLAGVLALNACIRCFLRRQAEEATAAGTGRMSAEVKMAARGLAVPTLVYSAGLKLAGTESECAICLSEFVNGEKVRVLPKCNHGFHDRCIEGWLASKLSCPTCRRSCFSPERDVVAGISAETRPERDVTAGHSAEPRPEPEAMAEP